MSECPACHRPVSSEADRCPVCRALLGSAPAPDEAPTGFVAADLSKAATVSSPQRRESASRSASHGSGGAAGPDLAPGVLVADRYRIVALLGRGGMGEVYRADDLRLGQPVALKFLPRLLDRDPVRLDRFLAEVRTARQVSHPNVCRVYDIGEVDGRHFLSMEYIDGEDLASLLRRIGRLPVDKALEITRQLCAALAAAHDKGVLHRDLKPANVMLDGRGKVRLTDFGLAEPQGASVDGEVAGTPAYMAPEQFAGRPASVQSDLYALGLVLYEIFGGKRAFEAPSIAELRRLHEESHAPLLTTSVRDLDPAVERVIFRCLEKDPANRPASAIAVVAALPGGDPLAAALAAGETPSPDMVAAAGAAGGMRPVVASACLAAVLIGLMGIVLVATSFSALSKLPLDEPPAVLSYKAREMLGRLGYQGAAVDSAHGYRWDEAYAEWTEAKDRRLDRWNDLAKGHTLLEFWHRTSPTPLVPERVLGERLVEGGAVRLGDPPRDVAGMTAIVLDVRGRLLDLDVVPDQFAPDAPPAAGAVDWPRVVAETGVDPATLASVAPQWTPPVFADQRAAWTATYPDLPNLPLRVEAAAYRGRPVYLRVIRPWTRPERHVPRSAAGTVGEVVGITVLLALSLGALVFARHNVVHGRGDRRGATRLAAAMAGIVLVALALEAHHVASLDEVVVLVRIVCWTLFGGAFTWVLYLALEPPIRRRWPTTLITWNRLLAGRFTDPLVGRDLLTGAIVGTAISGLASGGDLFERWSGGLQSAPGLRLVGPLLGAKVAASWFLLLVYDATFGALAVFFLVFLLRLVLRRDWLAAGAWCAVQVVQNVLANTNPWLAGVFSALVVGALMVALFRFGILSFAVAMLFLTVLTQFPLTSNVSAWYGSGSAVALVVLAAIACYGFRIALAGKPLLGAEVE